MKEQERDYVFGIRPVLEAIEADKEINRIMLQKGLQGELFLALFKEIRERNIPHQFVPEEKLYRVARKNHQGVVAFISPISYKSLDFIVTQLFAEAKNPLILILDRVTDVRNFGAICRTAECMGVHAVVVPKKGGALINGDAVKTSAGALHNLPVCREEFLKDTISYLQDYGLQVVGCTEKAEKSIREIDLSVPTAIIMGSEEDGISPAYLEMCNELGKIEMGGNTGSLNVSVATGMVLYEVGRQRN